MYGIKKENIQGNGRTIETMPHLAINITALEDDLFRIMSREGLVKFRLIQREKKDKFNNDYLLGMGNTSKANSMYSRISQRNPRTIIDVVITEKFLRSREVQKIKNASGFLKIYLLEKEGSYQNGSDFEIRAGHYQWDEKEVQR